MSEEISDKPQQIGSPSDPAPSGEEAIEEEDQAPRRLPLSWIAVASVFIVIPSIIPFYYAVQVEDTTIMLVLVAFGFGVVLINALIVVMLYRWILRMMD